MFRIYDYIYINVFSSNYAYNSQIELRLKLLWKEHCINRIPRQSHTVKMIWDPFTATSCANVLFLDIYNHTLYLPPVYISILVKALCRATARSAFIFLKQDEANLMIGCPMKRNHGKRTSRPPGDRRIHHSKTGSCAIHSADHIIQIERNTVREISQRLG